MPYTEKSVDDLFKVAAKTMKDIAEDNSLGFVIPEYQREYRWGKDEITRLHCDTLNGLYRLADTDKDSTDTSAYTFLGTIILVKQHKENVEPHFHGKSLEVIDGQQRLTTLTLMACAISEVLRRKYSKVKRGEDLRQDVQEWIDQEVRYWIEAMYSCSTGVQKIKHNRYHWFPRVCRSGQDHRGKSSHQFEYRSPIGKLLEAFENYSSEDGTSDLDLSALDEFPVSASQTSPYTDLKNRYKEVQDLVAKISDRNWYRKFDTEMFEVSCVHRKQCTSLLKNLPTEDKSKQRILSYVVNQEDTNLHDLIRTMIYASYFYSNITLTQVVAGDEYLAFEIFDALNTTGQPLTALETLKPEVKKYERNKAAGTEASQLFEACEKHLDAVIGTRKQRRQLETKELIITFALYWSGKKISKDLAQQRLHLRKEFRAARKTPVGDLGSPIHYLDSLRKTSRFRRYYWTPDGIDEINVFHEDVVAKQVKLLMRVVHDMNHSLTLPILTLYWEERGRYSSEQTDNFLSALKAIVAFIVLWRGYTGLTGGIDLVFRDLMSKSDFNLSSKYTSSLELKSVSELKDDLKTLFDNKLGARYGHINEKARWIEQVAEQPLYDKSVHLVRFMILAARDGSRAAKRRPGLLEKSSDIPTVGDLGFLDLSVWKHPGYRTIEHVAPRTRGDEIWDPKLYDNDTMIDSIGNLVLLPSLENSYIGNLGWEKKRTFYNALLDPDKSKVQDWIKKASNQGLEIPQKVVNNLSESYHLSLLDSVTNVETWDSELVSERGKNICTLCWDRVRDWLD